MTIASNIHSFALSSLRNPIPHPIGLLLSPADFGEELLVSLPVVSFLFRRYAVEKSTGMSRRNRVSQKESHQSQGSPRLCEDFCDGDATRFGRLTKSFKIEFCLVSVGESEFAEGFVEL